MTDSTANDETEETLLAELTRRYVTSRTHLEGQEFRDRGVYESLWVFERLTLQQLRVVRDTTTVGGPITVASFADLLRRVDATHRDDGTTTDDIRELALHLYPDWHQRDLDTLIEASTLIVAGPA